MEMIKVLSIDVGITNLGYIYAELTFNVPDSGSKFKNLSLNTFENFNKTDLVVLDCGRVDITNIQHRKVPFCDCKLLHDRCIPDYVDHFIQEHDAFEKCDILLIERQPPKGITNVQDLLFTRFRNKVKLLSPNSMHKYFHFSNDYEIRKTQSEKIANKFLSNFFQFNDNTRKHDIADALVMCIYYHKIHMDYLIRNTCYNKIVDLEKYRFNGIGT
jgi:hypothetical protein